MLAYTYIVRGSPAQVVIEDDDTPAVAAAPPCPSLGVLDLITLSLMLGMLGFTRSRKCIV